MAQNRNPFELAVAALRERLRDGAYGHGEALTVTALAGELGVSATPVREALARLAGEGLVEDRRGRGYFAWRLDVSDLTDLYRAQESLTLSALATLVQGASELATATAIPSGVSDVHGDGPLFWEALTRRVAQEAGHRYLLGVQRGLADRLAPARRVESMVLTDIDALGGLADQANRRAWRALAADLPPFFARRCAAAAAIIDRLRVELRR